MTENNMQEAVCVVQKGDLIVFPTDTVYGIGCDPFNEEAIGKTFQAKKRPGEKGIPVLVSSIEMARKFGDITPLCEQLINAHWPGALTVVVKQKTPFPKKLSWTDTVALRMPNHPIALELIEKCGGCLATTSANFSGKLPATTKEEALAFFPDVFVLDGGTTPGNLASTVVDCTTDVAEVLREGPIKI